jgi:selenocysteine lyase/cysteine desulfurase
MPLSSSTTKWERAAVEAEAVRAGFARLVGDSAENIALGQNTHELVTRWLSALPLPTHPRIVTTDGEFHSIRRQVDRIAEEGVVVIKVPARPVETLAERVIASLDSRTACAMVSYCALRDGRDRSRPRPSGRGMPA